MIADGHPAAWSYSPRQIAGFLELAGKRRNREMADTIGAVRLAMHGDKRQVSEALKDLRKD